MWEFQQYYYLKYLPIGIRVLWDCLCHWKRWVIWENARGSKSSINRPLKVMKTNLFTQWGPNIFNFNATRENILWIHTLDWSHIDYKVLEMWSTTTKNAFDSIQPTVLCGPCETRNTSLRTPSWTLHFLVDRPVNSRNCNS